MKREAHLSRLFDPRVVAVVGASDDGSKYGSQALTNLLSSRYDGNIYCIDPKMRDFGERVKTVATAAEIDEAIDVGFLAIPAASCPKLLSEMSSHCRFAIVAVSGFEDERSEDLKSALKEAAGDTRIVGPNCNGVYGGASGVSLGYNYGHQIAWNTGDVAVISQSGALFSDIATTLHSSGMGLQQFVSTGDELDLSFCDYFENALNSVGVRNILCVIDGVQEPKRFAACLQEARERSVRVVVVKFGNAAGSSALTQAHVGRMAGSSAVVESMCAAFGAVYTSSLGSGIVALQIVREGADNVHQVHAASMSGAGAMMLKDAAARQGVDVPPLSEEVSRALGSGQFSQTLNPYDFGAHGVNDSKTAFDAFSHSPGPILIHVTPPPTKAWQIAQRDGLSSLLQKEGHRTFLISLSKQDSLEALASDYGVPILTSMDEFFVAVRAVADISQEGHERRIDEQPPVLDSRVFDEKQSRRYLIGLGMEIDEGATVHDDRQSELDLHFPVAVKGLAPGIAHKNDNGLVALNVGDEGELRRSISAMKQSISDLNEFLVLPMIGDGPEFILGWRRDVGALHGVLVGGRGGSKAETYADLFSADLAAFLIAPREYWKILDCWRELSEDQKSVLVQFSEHFATSLSRVEGDVINVEINPVRLVKGSNGVAAVALDALVEVR